MAEKERKESGGGTEKERVPEREELKAMEKEIPWTAIEEMLMYRKKCFYGSSGQGGQLKEKCPCCCVGQSWTFHAMTGNNNTLSPTHQLSLHVSF